MQGMPELPDITVYVDALRKRILNSQINQLKVSSPFLLRTAVPDISEALGEHVVSVDRLGKRLALTLPNDRYLVIHLMIAGRLHWFEHGKKLPGKSAILQLGFEHGTLTLTEAGTKKRASLHFIDGKQALAEINPNGLEVLECSLAEFTKVLRAHNHTLKRALTSPRLLSGIGNAYSDEILHAAQLSPVALTQKLKDENIAILFEKTRTILSEWTEKLRLKSGDSFPEKVTAFREGMAVHGRFGKPCPVCETLVQRIRYVGRETNYCPRCQTNGKLLADRSLSRLLKADWPKTIEELEHKG